MIVSNVNFNLYKSFIAAYEAKNISKAAAALQITQPTVTYNIKELERQLGVKLFHTHPRGVEPTKDAHELYKFVSEGMTNIANGESAIKEFNCDSVTTLRITADYSLSGSYLAKAIAEFTKQFPRVTFELTSSGDADPVTRLIQHNTDIVIKFGSTEASGVGVVKVASLRKIAVASKTFVEQHKLGETVSKKQLEKLPIVMKSEIDGVKPFVKVPCARTMLSMVKQGIGVGITSSKNADDFNMDDLVVMEITDMDIPPCDVNVLYNKESAGKATRAFVQTIKDVYGA